MGKKNQPFFRIVVTEKNNPPRAGRFLEILGSYNPKTKEKNIKKDRIKYWIGVGAQVSDSIHNLLVQEKIIDSKKKPVHSKKKKKEEKPKTEGAPAEEKPKQETPEVKPDEKKEEASVEKEQPVEEKKKEPAEDKKEEQPKEENKSEEKS